MSLHQFHDASGVPLDAHFEVQDRILYLRGRGGTKGTPSARNTEYGSALRILLERVDRSDLRLEGVWVDSARVQNMPMEERRILSSEDTDSSPKLLFTKLSRGMEAVGRDSNSSSPGNHTKRLRFVFVGNIPAERIVKFVGLGKFDTISERRGRLSAAELEPVCADHIWRAVQQLCSGSAVHEFRESRVFDVVTDEGKRFPPKAVFGIAATEALGFDVKPKHFESGSHTICHKAIKDAGFEIVRKEEDVRCNDYPLNPDDRRWTEGHPRLVTHLRRERSAGISKAKKKDFEREHGRLYCERCQLDPIEAYGPLLGKACIEVHHIVPVAKVLPGHPTELKDLMCLCANCHRIVHKELRIADK